jgi:hypothetical protein
MTTLPARVAAAWRDTAWRYAIELPPPNFTGLTDAKHLPCRVVLVGRNETVFEGTHAECQAWVDEQCGRAAARVLLEAMGEPSEGMRLVGARSIRDSMKDTNFAQRSRECWTAMLAAFRREMGL